MRNSFINRDSMYQIQIIALLTKTYTCTNYYGSGDT